MLISVYSGSSYDGFSYSKLMSAVARIGTSDSCVGEGVVGAKGSVVVGCCSIAICVCVRFAFLAR